MQKSDYDKIAVALKYETSDNAPIVVAKGKGTIAEKIIEIANDEQIKVYDDSYLANSLYSIDLNQDIPEELYTAVAEILAFIYQLDREESLLNET